MCVRSRQTKVEPSLSKLLRGNRNTIYSSANAVIFTLRYFLTTRLSFKIPEEALQLFESMPRLKINYVVIEKTLTNKIYVDFAKIFSDCSRVIKEKV